MTENYLFCDRKLYILKDVYQLTVLSLCNKLSIFCDGMRNLKKKVKKHFLNLIIKDYRKWFFKQSKYLDNCRRLIGNPNYKLLHDCIVKISNLCNENLFGTCEILVI